MKTSELKSYWLSLMGCTESQVSSSGITICVHPPQNNYTRVLIFKSGFECIVSLPSKLLDQYSNVFRNLREIDVGVVSNLFGDKAEKIIGPAWIACVSDNTFVKQHGTETRLLKESDSDVLKDFIGKCSADEVRNSGFNNSNPLVVGSFFDGELVCLSNLTMMNASIGNIGVLTHAVFRGKGFARKAISAVTEIAISKNISVQYQTLVNNISSVKAAESVGFSKFAETISIKIHE